MKDEIKLFYNLYDYFYECDCHDYEYPLENCLNDLFDHLLTNDQEFKDQVNAFNKERQDIITSDREALSYMCIYLLTQELKRLESKEL